MNHRTKLSVCGRCSRHVFEHDERCPFCQAPREPRALTGLSRAALVGASLAVAACGSDGREPVAVYGAPPTPPPAEDAGAREPEPPPPSPERSDAGAPPGEPERMAPMYGAPEPPQKRPPDRSPAAYGGPPR
jgi:hypothetical protein